MTMASLLMGASAALATALVAPLPFDVLDRRHVRRRLTATTRRPSPPEGRRAGASPVAALARTWHERRRLARSDVDLTTRRSLETMGRYVRAGDSLVVAVSKLVEHEPAARAALGAVAQRCHRGATLADALRAEQPEHLVALHQALRIATEPHATGANVLHVLALGASLAADRHDVRQERRAHSAQARLSAMVLTWVPAAVALLSMSVDERVRHVLLATPLGGVCLVGGLGLAITGQRWIQRLVERDSTRSGLLSGRWRPAAHRAAQARHELPELVEALAVAVAGGATPAGAFRLVHPSCSPSLHPALDEVLRRLDRGIRFADAVTALRDHLGLDAAPVVELLVAADREGLPLEGVLAQLAAEARSQRRREAEAHARTLPVRLAAPLVLCTLPGFVLLAIVPLVAGALSSLSLP